MDALGGHAAVLLLRGLRHVDVDRMSAMGGRWARRIGPLLAENQIARDNLTAAFPEKSAAEIERILAGSWDNVGRVAAEYARLDSLWDADPSMPRGRRIEFDPEAVERFVEIRDDGRPALVFAAHLANWELPALPAATYGVKGAILYRAPNAANVARAITGIRALNMGQLIPTGPDAVFRLAAALEEGTHVGMLVDQHFGRGPEVQFFGRACRANPTLARLARHFECPIYGTRAIRLPGNRFRLEITPQITPARDQEGRIDVAGTMQVITSVIEGWIREYPEQWLWQHRRWR